jgi:hypothetical protein
MRQTDQVTLTVPGTMYPVLRHQEVLANCSCNPATLRREQLGDHDIELIYSKWLVIARNGKMLPTAVPPTEPNYAVRDNILEHHWNLPMDNPR